ncbi:MAG TPA: XdhC/CoxI family protein [Dehalococcoidia bacterium]|nr:XdhC/CoxI family protein [Dehalococcoidia bacterium]
MEDTGQLKAAIAREVLAALAGGMPVAVATIIQAPVPSPAIAPILLGAKLLVRADGSTLGSLGGGSLEEAVVDYCLELLPRPQTITFRLDSQGAAFKQAMERQAVEILVEVAASPPSLLVVGAGHVGRVLAQLGSLCGFRVVVLDDRPEYADPERFPLASQVLCDDFVSTLRSFPITADTHIVLVTRGHKHDEASLRVVVGSPAAYVGMIGSRRRVTTILQHLLADGYPRETVERVRTPIGLDIGAETPAEIAVSIIAEIIMLQRGGTGAPMSQVVDVRRHLFAGRQTPPSP